MVVVLAAAPQQRVTALSGTGAEVIKVGASMDGRVDLTEVLAELGRRDVISLLVEAGGTVQGSLFDEGLVDKVYAFIAPLIVGGSEAASPVEGSGVARMADAWRLDRVRVQQVGDDWLMVGYPRGVS